jgi:hypothetical protein
MTNATFLLISFMSLRTRNVLVATDSFWPVLATVLATDDCCKMTPAVAVTSAEQAPPGGRGNDRI